MVAKTLKILFCVIISSLYFEAIGQNNLDSLRNNKYYKIAMDAISDTNYVGTIGEKFSISPVFTSAKYGLTISDVWPIGSDINYLPQANNRIGIKVRYKGFGAGLSFQLPANDFIYGKTKSQNLTLNMQLTFFNWGSDFFFIRNKGHYIENAKSANSNWVIGTPYPQRSDLTVTNIGFSTQAVLSNKFSMKAALHQTEIQKKSAGGFSFGGMMYFSRFSADSAIIPLLQLKYYQDSDSLSSGSFLTMALAPGYSYTYVYDAFFITGSALIGAGPQLQLFRINGTGTIPRIGIKVTSYISYRFSFGYNTNKYFAAFVYSYINNKARVRDTKFNFEQKGITLSVGMRFN